jgi:hypothetical protein
MPEHEVRLVDRVVDVVKLELVVVVGLTAFPGPAPPLLLVDVEVVIELDEEDGKLEAAMVVLVVLVAEVEMLVDSELDEEPSAQFPAMAVI